jgi:hypothetical protein
MAGFGSQGTHMPHSDSASHSTLEQPHPFVLLTSRTPSMRIFLSAALHMS